MASSPTPRDEDAPPRPQDADSFLDHFLTNHRSDNFISVKHGNYTVNKNEIVGEVVDWTMQYLQYMSCPASLEAGLTRAVLDEAKVNYLNDNPQDQVDATSISSNTKGFRTLNLLQNVTSTVNEVCRRLRSEDKPVIQPSRLVPHSVCAVKNGRRKMEDRHVVIHDMNVIFSGHANQSSEDVPVSFYGVYDGHAGRDAAAFAASHLHGKIIESPFYPADPVSAIKDAFNKTDLAFLDKGKYESLKSGTTAVVTLIRGNTLYSAWLGDSQSVLVRDGKPVKIVEPHKPNRPDEKQRIESLGGSVIHWGTWRVNGQLAVSRAIGDGDYKPYVSADPDVTSIEMNGTEDFIIIACDGLWDTVTPEDATNCVFTQLRADKDNLDLVSQKLMTLAKDNGSSDNITIVVVFLRPVDQLISRPHPGDTKENLYEGITSTSEFITNGNKEDSFRFFSNENDLSQNPFTSPSVAIQPAIGNPFASPDGGFNFENPFAGMDQKDGLKSTEDPDDSIGGVIDRINSEKFCNASPSIFDDSSVFQKDTDRNSSDFMANQANAWIPSPTVAQVGSSDPQNSNPFADSENVTSASGLNGHKSQVSNDDENQHNEVTKLLSSGIIETQFGEFMMSARNETPTPPVEDTGSTLEDILAAVRDQPDTVEDDDDDSDSSEEHVDTDLNLEDSGYRQQTNEVVSSDSDEEENDIGFTFLKQDTNAKSEVILKSALTDANVSDSEDDVNEDQHHFVDNAFERTEPLITRQVEASFLEQHVTSSNIVDLTKENDDDEINRFAEGQSQDNEIFSNPFYQSSQFSDTFDQPQSFGQDAGKKNPFGQDQIESKDPFEVGQFQKNCNEDIMAINSFAQNSEEPFGANPFEQQKFDSMDFEQAPLFSNEQPKTNPFNEEQVAVGAFEDPLLVSKEHEVLKAFEETLELHKEPNWEEDADTKSSLESEPEKLISLGYTRFDDSMEIEPESGKGSHIFYQDNYKPEEVQVSKLSHDNVSPIIEQEKDAHPFEFESTEPVIEQTHEPKGNEAFYQDYSRADDTSNAGPQASKDEQAEDVENVHQGYNQVVESMNEITLESKPSESAAPSKQEQDDDDTYIDNEQRVEEFLYQDRSYQYQKESVEKCVIDQQEKEKDVEEEPEIEEEEIVVESESVDDQVEASGILDGFDCNKNPLISAEDSEAENTPQHIFITETESRLNTFETIEDPLAQEEEVRFEKEDNSTEKEVPTEFVEVQSETGYQESTDDFDPLEAYLAKRFLANQESDTTHNNVHAENEPAVFQDDIIDELEGNASNDIDVHIEKLTLESVDLIEAAFEDERFEPEGEDQKQETNNELESAEVEGEKLEFETYGFSHEESETNIQQVPAGSVLNALDPEPIPDSAPSSLESQSGPSSVIVESQEVPTPDQASFFIKASEREMIELPTPQEAVVTVIEETSHQSPILEESEEVTSDSEEKSVAKVEEDTTIQAQDETKDEPIVEIAATVELDEPAEKEQDDRIEVEEEIIETRVEKAKEFDEVVEIPQSTSEEQNDVADDEPVKVEDIPKPAVEKEVAEVEKEDPVNEDIAEAKEEEIVQTEPVEASDETVEPTSEDQTEPSEVVIPEPELVEPSLANEEAVPEPVLEEHTLANVETVPEPVVEEQSLVNEDDVPEPELAKVDNVAEPELAKVDNVAEPELAKEDDVPEPELAKVDDVPEPELAKVDVPEPELAKEVENSEPATEQDLEKEDDVPEPTEVEISDPAFEEQAKEEPVVIEEETIAKEDLTVEEEQALTVEEKQQEEIVEETKDEIFEEQIVEETQAVVNEGIAIEEASAIEEVKPEESDSVAEAQASPQPSPIPESGAETDIVKDEEAAPSEAVAIAAAVVTGAALATGAAVAAKKLDKARPTKAGPPASKPKPGAPAPKAAGARPAPARSAPATRPAAPKPPASKPTEVTKKPLPSRPVSATASRPTSAAAAAKPMRQPVEKKEVERKPISARPASATTAKPAPKPPMSKPSRPATADQAKLNGEKEKKPAPATSKLASARPTVARTSSPRPTPARTASPRPTAARTASPRPTAARTASPRPTVARTASPKPPVRNGPASASVKSAAPAPKAKPGTTRPVTARPPPTSVPKAAPTKKPAAAAPAPARPTPARTGPASTAGKNPPRPTTASSPAKKSSLSSSGPKPTDLTKRKASPAKKADDPAVAKVNGDLGPAEVNGLNGHHDADGDDPSVDAAKVDA